MPQKSDTGSKRGGKLFVFCVIVLSVSVVAVLAATFISHASATKGKAIAEKTIAALSGGFSCTADVKLGNNEYEVNFQKPSGGGCVMSFVKPSNLTSLSFEKTDEGMKVKFGSLEAAVDASSIPQSSVFNAVWGAFNSCLTSSIKASARGSDTTISGDCPAGAFTLTLDSEMKPKSLTIPSLNLSATFKDFKYTQ